jgi:Flp pilus assembly protein TadD
MISTKMKILRLSVALLGSVSAFAAAPAAARVQQFGAQTEDAGTALTRHLRTLAEQPRSVSALTGAGRAALELGDPQAALTFFARAEEIAPRDGRVKAGMGSVFLLMEEPRTAMRLFTEAASLGVPEAEFSGDRGLVHDLDGNPRRAQADYTLALSRQENDEVRRRLALSLAISGDRDRALSTIDAQLRRQDRAAWRTRAFILALSGDAAGATQVAQSTIPAQAAQLQPFFARLSSLSPAQRAMAVHFGHFPEGGRQSPSTGSQYASAAPVPSANAATQAGRPDSNQRAFGTRSKATPKVAPPTAAPAQTASREEPQSGRRQPGRSKEKTSVAVGRRVLLPPVTVAEAPPAALPTAQPAAQPPVSTPAQPAANLGALVESLPADTAPAPAPEPRPIELAQAQPAPQQPAAPAPSTIQTTDLPPSSVEVPQPSASASASPPASAPAPAPAPAPAGVGATFAGIAAAIAALPEETPLPEPAPARTQLAEAKVTPPAAKPAPAKAPAAAAKDTKPKPDTAKKAAPEKPAAAKKEAPPKETSRHWVQIAGGANAAAMTREFDRIKAKAPKLLAGRTPWTTPLRATNRLLVGPFKTTKEAQEFVNDLAKLDLPAFSWTSPAGQEIAKLTAK